MLQPALRVARPISFWNAPHPPSRPVPRPEQIAMMAARIQPVWARGQDRRRGPCALLLYAYCQGERSSRVIERRCVRDVAYRVICGGLRPDHATIARFRAGHERALGGLFSQVLRLLAAEGMVSLGVLSLDGTKLAGNASQKANRTLPQIEKVLAETAAADAADDARHGGAAGPAAPDQGRSPRVTHPGLGRQAGSGTGRAFGHGGRRCRVNGLATGCAGYQDAAI